MTARSTVYRWGNWRSGYIIGRKTGRLLGSHLSADSNPAQVIKGSVGRCKATIPFYLSLIINKLLTQCLRQTARTP